jgi:mannose-6-phosphate isomerase-like protein (cupin superfamily)
MKNPIFRKISEWKDKDAGYIIFDKEAEIIASNVMTVKKGKSTGKGSHHNEEEVYVVISGRGRVRVNDVENEVEPGMVIYIPRNAVHESTGLSDEDFVFLCVAIYFDRKPEDQNLQE